MIGLRVIKFTDILPVTQVDLATEDPLVLLLEGSGFLRASEVFINGQAASIEKIYDDATMEVTVPTALKDTFFESLIVVSDTYSGRTSSQIKFELGDPHKKITGALKLFQHFVKLLLTTPGTDIFYRGTGGGLQHMGGVVTSVDNAGPLAGRVVAAIKRVERQLIASQSGKAMPPDEKLRSTETLDLTYDKYTSSLLVKVALTTVGGQGVMGSLGL